MTQLSVTCRSPNTRLHQLCVCVILTSYSSRAARSPRCDWWIWTNQCKPLRWRLGSERLFAREGADVGGCEHRGRRGRSRGTSRWENKAFMLMFSQAFRPFKRVLGRIKGQSLCAAWLEFVKQRCNPLWWRKMSGFNFNLLCTWICKKL